MNGALSLFIRVCDKCCVYTSHGSDLGEQRGVGEHATHDNQSAVVALFRD